MNKRTVLAGRQGFTLIEIIMAMVIAGVIASIFGVIINSGMGAWFFVKGQQKIMMETGAVMKRMVREIRMTSGNFDSSILIFTEAQYKFKDVNNNTIDYRKNGANLERNGAILLQNLAGSGGLRFVYLNSGGNPTTAKSAIRAVQIKLTVEEGENRICLQSAAGIRNR
jgi:prepilin-type N-terminal cleavage/methylation domain-containing protein